MAKFRKKPVVIEAVQLGLAEWADRALPIRDKLPQWLLDAWDEGKITPFFGDEDYWYLDIDTLEGTMRAGPDDWIIRGIQGELYPCKPDIFRATYEAVPEENTFVGLADELPEDPSYPVSS